MGRKNKLPPSSGGTQAKRKQDTGLPAFFKHRREQEQRRMAASVVAPAMTQQQQQSVKGKERDTETAQSLAESVGKTMQADAVTSAEAGDSSWSQYDHLNGNFSGGNKDSSLRAYARHLRSLISQSDVLIQILDARDPMGSRSLSTEALISAHPGKRLLFVLTKIDLVPKTVLQGWLEKLRETHATLAFKSTSTLSGTGRASRKLHTHTDSSSAAASSSLEGSTAATLLQLLKNYARSQPKGMSLTVGIFGQPNVGKSSLINSLVRSRACSVAPRPGETKTLQTVLLDRKVRLVDSPGVAMGGGGGGGASEDIIKDVLRGTVKLELVEDPITPVGEILRRADPVKVTKLYRLPLIEEDGGQEEGEGGYAGNGMDAVVEPQAMVPDVDERAREQKQHQVDFKSLRAGREEMDESDDEEDDASSFIFNHSDHGDEDDHLDAASSNIAPSYPPRGAIGYDRHDPMDFLLRLALTRGKMLRGGKPDVEGAARGVINDWNTGKITWCVAPPPKSKKEKKKAQEAEAKMGEERDDEMKPAAAAAEAKTADAPTDETTVVSGFSDAFDLEGLFAQADAQIFGGSSTTSKGNAAPAPAPPAAPPINKTVLQAADVSASSLGKRGRGGVGVAESDEEAAAAVDDESDVDSEDDDEDAQPKRMQLQPSATSAAQGEEDDEMAPRGARPQPQQQRPVPSTEDKELSSFLESAAKDAARNTSSPQQHQQQHQRPTGGFTPSGKPKRGQRHHHNKKSSSSSKEEPEYLSRLAHKATLPTNVKKSVGKRDQYIEEDAMMGARPKGKRGDERRKKRKMARREEIRDGGVGVVSGLQDVTLGDE